MKLIIDINEEEYKEVLEDTYSGTPFENKIFTIIANGTPYKEKPQCIICKKYRCNGCQFYKEADNV